jgi:hypothetical protein
MNRDGRFILYLIVGVLGAILLLKLLGALVGLAIKVVLLLALVGVCGIVYLAVSKNLRGPRA